MNGSTSSTATVGRAGDTQQYQLSDDLAKLCLPSEYKDATRTLAWVNSICLLFLIIGVIGIKQPIIVRRPLSEIVEPVAVELPPPQEQPQIQPETPPEETPQETTTDVPQIATVVAAADPSQVAFSVPVVGAVAVKEAKFATPPPPVTFAPPKMTRFDPNAAQGGSFPPPDYPGLAQRNNWQGKVTLEIKVDATGTVTSVTVLHPSGKPVLDEAAMKVVKTKWKFPPGPERDYTWDCTFQL
jgi:protein TonB